MQKKLKKEKHKKIKKRKMQKKLKKRKIQKTKNGVDNRHVLDS